MLAALIALGCSPGPEPRRDGAVPVDGETDAGPTPIGDGGVDAGADAGPCSAPASTLCGERCVDLESDPANCGSCDEACPPIPNGERTCEASSCGFRCVAGFTEAGGECVPTPRPISPPSLSTVRGSRPVLRFFMPEGIETATAEVCEDQACERPLFEGTGDGSVEVDADLPVGPVFFRVRAGDRVGPTWRFDVRAVDRGSPPAWGLNPDYDRDGLGDVALGAPAAVGDAGRVTLHRGRAGGPPSAPDAIVRGEEAGDRLGAALGCAGDLDGDGFADLAIGAPGAGEGGEAWILFGGPEGISELHSRRARLEAPADGGLAFGGALAGAGDVDGDGYGDLLVAAVGDGLVPGRVHLFRGRAGGVEPTPSQTFTGAGRFGLAVAAAGDLDGDGFADVAIGAPFAASMRGQAHIFLGGPEGLPASASLVLEGPEEGGQFGASLASAGDVTGDGLADLLVGAPQVEGARGRVYLFAGGADEMSAEALTTLSGTHGGAGFFGFAVASLGDVNLDGLDDLVVGAFGVGDRRGRLYTFLGAPEGPSSASRRMLEGANANGDFGWALAVLGDTDGDGRPDIAVGSPGADLDRGRAFILRGASDGVIATALTTMLGTWERGRFGRSVAGGHR